MKKTARKLSSRPENTPANLQSGIKTKKVEGLSSLLKNVKLTHQRNKKVHGSTTLVVSPPRCMKHKTVDEAVLEVLALLKTDIEESILGSMVLKLKSPTLIQQLSRNSMNIMAAKYGYVQRKKIMGYMPKSIVEKTYPEHCIQNGTVAINPLNKKIEALRCKLHEKQKKLTGDDFAMYRDLLHNEFPIMIQSEKKAPRACMVKKDTVKLPSGKPSVVLMQYITSTLPIAQGFLFNTTSTNKLFLKPFKTIITALKKVAMLAEQKPSELLLESIEEELEILNKYADATLKKQKNHLNKLTVIPPEKVTPTRTKIRNDEIMEIIWNKEKKLVKSQYHQKIIKHLEQGLNFNPLVVASGKLFEHRFLCKMNTAFQTLTNTVIARLNSLQELIKEHDPAPKPEHLAPIIK